MIDVLIILKLSGNYELNFVVLLYYCCRIIGNYLMNGLKLGLPDAP